MPRTTSRSRSPAGPSADANMADPTPDANVADPTPDANMADPTPDANVADPTAATTSAFAQGFRQLVGLQLLGRLLTFALNQLLLLRLLTPSVLGLVSVQLELVLGTVLFLSREAVRCALLRADLVEDVMRAGMRIGVPVPGHPRGESAQGNGDDASSSFDKVSPPPRLRKRRTTNDKGTNDDTMASPLAPLSPHERQLEQVATAPETLLLHRNFQRIVNMSYVPVALACFISAGAYHFYTVYAWRDRPTLHAGVALYCLAAVIETLVEPMYIVSQNLLLYQARVQAEMKAVVVRSVVCFALVVLMHGGESVSTMDDDNLERIGVLAFGWAQLAYAMLLLLGYLRFFDRIIKRNHKRHVANARSFWRKLWRLEHGIVHEQHSLLKHVDEQRVVFLQSWRCLTPQGVDGEGLLDGALIRLALTFTGQSFVKYLLTEGDKLIMATISSSYDQGVYALVSNYGSVKEESSFQLILRMSSHSKNSGSLIVRIVFLPLEESSRMLFSKLMQVRTNTAEAAIRCAKLIALTIKCNLYLGVLLLVFGGNFASLFIRYAAGRRWSEETDAATALAVYCAFIPILGINGITESFAHAVADENELHAFTAWMVASFGMYAAAAVVMIRGLGWGTSGLIIANAINMGLRIARSSSFMMAKLASRAPNKASLIKIHTILSWTSMRPHAVVRGLSAFAMIILLAIRPWVNGTVQMAAMYVAVGTFLGLAVVRSLWLVERPFITELRGLAK